MALPPEGKTWAGYQPSSEGQSGPRHQVGHSWKKLTAEARCAETWGTAQCWNSVGPEIPQLRAGAGRCRYHCLLEKVLAAPKDSLPRDSNTQLPCRTLPWFLCDSGFSLAPHFLPVIFPMKIPNGHLNSWPQYPLWQAEQSSFAAAGIDPEKQKGIFMSLASTV